jgi:hypothetical protein
MIFDLALSEQNGKKAIEPNAYYYRPDYTHFRYIDTVFLRTCKRVYVEARHLLQENITYRFWIGSLTRAAPASTFCAFNYLGPLFCPRQR